MIINKKLLIFVPLLFGFFVSQVASAGNGPPGSSTNPVITKSYAEKVLGPLKSQISNLQAQIAELKGAKPPVVKPPAQGSGSFKDVPSSYWAYADITFMVSKGIIAGQGDGNFGPAKPTRRSELAVMLVKALNLPVAGTNANFTDVNKSHWAYSYIAAAQKNGIISGFPDGQFKPDEYVTRGQMAVMLKRAYSLAVKKTAADFIDVPEGYWAYDSIMALADNNISKGYENGAFRPSDPVRRAEVAVFLAKAMDPSRRK